QLEERLREGARHLRVETRHLAPAVDLLVGLDLEIGLGADDEGTQGGDLDVAGLVLTLAGRFGGNGVGQGEPAGGDGTHGAEKLATAQVVRIGGHGRNSVHSELLYASVCPWRCCHCFFSWSHCCTRWSMRW